MQKHDSEYQDSLYHLESRDGWIDPIHLIDHCVYGQQKNTDGIKTA